MRPIKIIKVRYYHILEKHTRLFKLIYPQNLEALYSTFRIDGKVLDILYPVYTAYSIKICFYNSSSGYRLVHRHTSERVIVRIYIRQYMVWINDGINNFRSRFVSKGPGTTALPNFCRQVNTCYLSVLFFYLDRYRQSHFFFILDSN